MVDLGGADGITASAADAEHSDALLVHQRVIAQEVGGGAEVLNPRLRAFDMARLSAALAVMRGVECERHITKFRQLLRIQPGGLFLHAAERMADDHGGLLPGTCNVFRNIQVSDHFNPEAVPETDLFDCHFLTGRKGIARSRGTTAFSQCECYSRQDCQYVLFHDHFSCCSDAGSFFQCFRIARPGDFDFV